MTDQHADSAVDEGQISGGASQRVKRTRSDRSGADFKKTHAEQTKALASKRQRQVSSDDGPDETRIKKIRHDASEYAGSTLAEVEETAVGGARSLALCLNPSNFDETVSSKYDGSILVPSSENVMTKLTNLTSRFPPLNISTSTLEEHLAGDAIPSNTRAPCAGTTPDSITESHAGHQRALPTPGSTPGYIQSLALSPEGENFRPAPAYFDAESAIKALKDVFDGHRALTNKMSAELADLKRIVEESQAERVKLQAEGNEKDRENAELKTKLQNVEEVKVSLEDQLLTTKKALEDQVTEMKKTIEDEAAEARRKLGNEVAQAKQALEDQASEAKKALEKQVKEAKRAQGEDSWLKKLKEPLQMAVKGGVESAIRTSSTHTFETVIFWGIKLRYIRPM